MADAPNTTSANPGKIPLQAAVALREGNMVLAIMMVREHNKTGLAEAKQIVEDYVETQPQLQAAFIAGQKSRRRFAWTSVAVIIAIIGLIWFAIHSI
jgi:hypothetical protein